MRDWTASPGGWIEKSECTKHDQCPAGAFCKWSWTDSNEGWFYVGGVCRACSACECNGDAVDGNCPRDKCPMQPSQEVICAFLPSVAVLMLAVCVCVRVPGVDHTIPTR